jgi:hypothetical protein
VGLSDFMLTGGLNLFAPFSLQLTYSQLIDDPLFGVIAPGLCGWIFPAVQLLHEFSEGQIFKV